MTQSIMRNTASDTVNGLCSGPGHAANLPFVGNFTSGSSTTTNNGLGVVRVGDTGVTNCGSGHHIKATTGSPINTADGLAIHRVGDIGIVVEGGTYTAASSGGNYKAN